MNNNNQQNIADTKSPKNKKKNKKRAVLFFFLKFFGVLLVIGAGFLGYMLYTLKGETPTELIESYSPISPSIIYDINGNQLDTITVENRDPISIKDVPLDVQNAFLAIEDKKFITHHGFDFARISRGMYL